MVTATPGEIGQEVRRIFDSDTLLNQWHDSINQNLTTVQRNRIAGAAMDTTAGKIFAYLGRETSLKWDEVADTAHSDWPDAAKAVGLLTWAGLCQPGSKRLRLTETGINLLEDPAGAQVA